MTEPVTQKRPIWAKKLLLSALLSLFLLELGTKCLVAMNLLEMVPSHELSQGSLYVPHQHLGYLPRPLVYREKYRDGYLRINSLGYRGGDIENPKSEFGIRIVCLGGSTTFSTKVGNETTYPALLQTILNDKGVPCEVINAGVGAYTSAETLINLETRVLDLQPDLLVIYHGVNDVHPRVTPGFQNDYSHYRKPFVMPEPSILSKLAVFSTFAAVLDHQGQKKVGIHKLTTNLDFEVVKPEQQEENFRRTDSSVYRQNLKSVVDLAESKGIEVVLVSFFFQPEMLEESQRFSSYAYSAGIAEHNQAMEAIAKETSAHFLDLSKGFPVERRDLFKDVVHLNSDGTRVKAELIYRGLDKLNLRAF
jgi:lysophospholipase L1-like esterase